MILIHYETQFGDNALHYLCELLFIMVPNESYDSILIIVFASSMRRSICPSVVLLGIFTAIGNLKTTIRAKRSKTFH